MRHGDRLRVSRLHILPTAKPPIANPPTADPPTANPPTVNRRARHARAPVLSPAGNQFTMLRFGLLRKAECG
jgi:hypothetical protein